MIGAALALTFGGAGASALAHGDRHHHGRDHGSRVSAADKTYVQTSIEGDLFEIQGGKLAQQKAGSEDVRAYGAKLVADHTKSLNDATDLAQKLGVEVPKAPTPSEQWELQTIGGLSGSQFDTAYADLEAKDHQQDISEATDEVKDGTSRMVRQSAKQELPTLQEHLGIAEKLGGKEGINPTSG